LRSSLEITARRDLATRRLRDVRVTLIGAAAVAAVLFGVAWKSLTAAPKLSTAQEVRNNDPKFVDWFEQQPHVNIEANVGNVRGSDTAAVTLIEFSDFECSHCNAFHRTIDELLRDRSAAVRVIFRHFPLDSECNSAVTSRFHSNACQAAIAAECAAEQGKFWQYHDLLFANQEHLQAQSYLEFAAQLGIDRGRFETCLRADAPRARVERDAKAGAVLGVSSTPTIFINARMIKGALDIAELQKALILAASEPR
jgi:protein-disulfide isomerase